MKKIVFTGPESTGKSTLSNQVASYFNTPYVEEYARGFIDDLDRNYLQEDLTEIAKGQLQLEENLKSKVSNLLVCDTDLLTIKIWSEFKYGKCDEWIIDELKNNLPDYYLLCSPDIDWEEDEQREHANEREKLFEIYITEIINLEVPFDVITGDGEERLELVKKTILKL